MILVGLALLRPFWSTVVKRGRHTVGTIPLALWLGGIWGAEGVLIGQALGGVIFGALAVWLALRAIAAPAVVKRGPPPVVAEAPHPVPGERQA